METVFSYATNQDIFNQSKFGLVTIVIVLPFAPRFFPPPPFINIKDLLKFKWLILSD